jgi:hypothetical protein
MDLRRCRGGLSLVGNRLLQETSKRIASGPHRIDVAVDEDAPAAASIRIAG